MMSDKAGAVAVDDARGTQKETVDASEQGPGMSSDPRATGIAHVTNFHVHDELWRQ
jgi:hypothetical protein